MPSVRFGDRRANPSNRRSVCLARRVRWMRLFGTYKGQPVVAWAVFQGKTGARVVVIGIDDHPIDIALQDFQLPKVPKRLRKKVAAYARAETRAARAELGEPN